MPSLKVVFLSAPDASYLPQLKQVPSDVDLLLGNSMEEVGQAVEDADVLVNGMGTGNLFKQVFPRAKKLQWVHSLSAGVENVLIPELVNSELPLTNARGVFAESLGEFVLASMLFFAKHLGTMRKNQAERKWDQFDVDVLFRQSMAVVGYGEIGKAAARRGKALGMKVYATRRRPELMKGDPIVDEAFSVDRRAEMMSKADYVVVSAALTPETRGLVGEKEIAGMKKTGVIINVGRGPVIDEAALIQALQEKRIRGAGLDVFDHEPLPQAHPFWGMENVLMSPHCADHIEGWLDDAARFFLQNLERFKKGEELKNIVDKHAGY